MKILFIHQKLISFIERDIKILESAHQVRQIQFRGLRDILALVSGTMWCDLTFSWFGKLHAYFAVLFSKLLGKKTVVVAGGDDVAYEPDIHYGMFSFWWKKWCPLFLFRHADLILSVSGYNHRETIENARADPKKVKLVYHGFDALKWRPMPGIEKEILVLTVGRVTNENIIRKGLELFVRSAAYLPDVPFVLVGPWKDSAIESLKAIAPPNVTFTGVVSEDDLVRMYNRAKVYVQVSRHEGFGCSVAEAMLCECVPVVSRRTALPEVVGDCGFYMDNLSPENVAAQIEKALASDLGRQARERIAHEFPLEKRRDGLLAFVEEVMRS